MITVSKEPFSVVYKEISPLWEKHYKEIALDKEKIKLNPHIEAYNQFQELNSLHVFTLRDDGKLIGYSFFFLQYSFHYKQLVLAVNDLFYILPEYRGKFLGAKLLREAERLLKKLGVHQIQMRTKTYASFGKLLERCGYTEIETAYRKNIAYPDS